MKQNESAAVASAGMLALFIITGAPTMKMKKPRSWYAITYAYGRDAINSRGIRADHVHRFPTKAARVAFVHAHDGSPFDVDSLPAKDTRVQTANRYAAQGLEWPIAVL